ncbi:hypothetical protein Goshw_002247 [Gossypium schwendimanii]|uniref:RING-type E3 ubiquitin transferase n=1 Tax=Gossypium schwendimanii TaxID=34291 RepID=A0A7J9NGM4_GOSSC|nr:hypothetical protein [Gossypium schwendimanii]
MEGREEIKGSKPSFPLSFWEVTMAFTVVMGFVLGLGGVYLTMPASDYSFLKLPRSLEDLHILRDHLEIYTSDYTLQVLVGYCAVYIFMQTFMIPGTVFMSLLAGALFGVLKGVALVVITATAGASSCYFLSKLVGRPLVISLWPDKLSFFQAQVAQRRESLLNYMLFLRLTPTLPNTFINVASPIVDVPYHIFFMATFIGLIPAAFLTVRAGIALGELQSVGDLYDFNSIATLFLIGVVSCLLEYIASNRNIEANTAADVVVAAAPEDTANKSNGLDPELVQAFPTFYYSTVKEFRREKYGLECAICLGEFVDDDMLRLLTICCHVFHKECVDLWLESNKTCPVCRGELDVPRKSLEKSPVLLQSNSMHQIGANQSPLQNAVCIEIKEDNKEKADEAQSSSTTKEHHKKREGVERFFRSNSTGHSIFRTREEDDKYTLRLLDHVKIKILRGHKAAISCTSFRDFTSPLNSKNAASGETSESLQGDLDKV